MAIDWPILLSQAEISAKGSPQPDSGGGHPLRPPSEAVLGGSGQIDSTLRSLLPDVVAPGRDELDLADHDLVINAATMTAVDAADTLDPHVRRGRAGGLPGEQLDPVRVRVADLLADIRHRGSQVGILRPWRRRSR